jgi:anaerobic ribonucleoside-triphosphate reductase
MHVIARLCNRNLRQYHKEIASKNIFEYLIEEDSNKKLFIKYSDLLRYQKDRRDSIPSKAANENPLPRGAMVTIVDETMLTQSELHYDIEEIRKVEEYLLYYISTDVQVRQAKQLYDILFKEM